MNGHHRNKKTCSAFREGLQEYLDGTLPKQTSLEFFLHLRDCQECSEEHDKLRSMFQLLDSLPGHTVPEGFDAPILASVPYSAYREMALLRRERVPVFLEEEFLPSFVKSTGTRLAGVAVAALSVGWYLWGQGPGFLPLTVGVGLMPEFLVRLQSFGRFAALAVRRSEG